MVAIVSGSSLGLDLGSMRTLGQQGVAGAAETGRSGEQVFVNVATGNLVVQDTDDVLVARGDDAVVLRTYNSLGTFNDDNGDNWTTGLALQPLALVGTLGAAGSTLSRTDRDGSVAVYAWDATRTAYISREGDGACDTISVVAADNQLEWRDGDTGVAQRYEASGAMRLLASRDTAGNALVFGYNAAGRLASATTASGETTWYDYAGNNLSQVRSVTAGGVTTTRVRYAYDASNRLTGVTVDLSPSDNSIADGKTYQTSYTYDGTSRRVASLTQADGTSLAFTYVQSGATWRIASIRDALNQTTSFTYSLSPGVAGFATVTDPLGLVTRYDIDAAGRLTRITAPPVAGVSPTTQFAWNANGDLVSVTDAEGRTTSYGYDGNGNRVLERDAAGNTVTRTFDAANQLLTETRYLLPDPDGAGPSLPGAGTTSRYVHEGGARNLLRFTVSAEGRVTEYRYDGFGQRVAEIAYAAAWYPVAGLAASASPTESDMVAWRSVQNLSATQRTDIAWDARGQVQARTRFARVDGQGAGIADGSQSLEQSVHDQAGQLLQSISAGGGTTTATWDGLGRLLSTTDALGQTQLTQYFDSARKTVTTLAGGLVRTSVFDAAGQLVAQQESNAAALLLGETRYVYDAGGRLRMTQDPTGVRNWFLFDDAGRKIADIDGNGTLAEYGYDKAGLLTVTTRYATAVNVGALVDASGLPVPTLAIGAIRPVASSSDAAEWRAYDSAGRLVRTASRIGTGTGTAAAVTEFRYDGASRLVETVQYANPLSAGPAPGAIASPGPSVADRSTRRFYDGDGRLVGVLDAEGFLGVVTYDAAGRVAERMGYSTATVLSLRTAGTLAQLRPAAAADDQREVNWYDGRGLGIGALDAEGFLTETVYDAAANATQVVRYATRVAGTPAASANLGSVRPPASAADQPTTRTFDVSGRLTQETAPGGIVTQYGYDAAGRLSSTVRAAGSAESRTLLARFDLQGRLTGELSAEGAALLTGGQTQAQVDAIWSQYGSLHAYDAAGRRVATTDPAGNRTTFFYDADGALAVQVNALGEVQETRRDVLGRVTDQVRYAGRLATAGLGGGLVTTSLTTALAALANAALDSRATTTWTRDGHVATSVDALGNGTTFSYDGFGGEIGSTQAIAAGSSLVLTYTVDRRGLRTATVADASGVNAVTSTTYDAFGRPVRTVDANGSASTQSWDRLGRVVATVDPLNVARTTSFDAFGRVLTQTDALGAVTSYAYDVAARTMTVTSAEGIVTATTSNRHGQVQSVSDGKGQVTTSTYDRNGRLVRTDGPSGTTFATYDGAGRLAQATDANGNKVSYGYDAASRVTSRTVDPGGLNLVTTWQVDAKGQRVSTTDPMGVVTTTEFDRKGQVVKQTVDPAGLNLQTSYTWDGAGRVLAVTAPGGSVVQTQYDRLGRRTRETVDPGGLAIATTWTYDRNGNVVSRIDPRGGTTRYVYDAASRLVFTVDPLGCVRQVVYDAGGRVARTVAYATTISPSLPSLLTSSYVQARLSVQAARDVVEHRVYDKDSRVVATVDGTGGVVKFAYDANGNVVSRIAYANRIALAGWTVGSVPAPTADAAHDMKTATVYDAADRALFTVDGMGAVVASSYDGNGNVLQRIAYAATIPTTTAPTAVAVAAAVTTVANPARDAVVRNAWDAAGRLAWSADGTGAVTQRVYDKAGNVVRQVAYAAPVAAGAALSSVVAAAGDRATSMAYDAAGRLVFRLDALRAVVEQAFDAAGNVVRRTAYATPIASVPALGQSGTVAAIRASVAATASDRSERFGYDAAGREVLAIDTTGAVTEKVYDAASAVVTLTSRANLANTAGVAATPTLAALKALVTASDLDRVARRAYDAAGRLQYEVDGANAVTARQYDGANRLTRLTRYYTPIAASALTATQIAQAITAHASDQAETYAYNAAGQQTSVTDALGVAETFTFNGLGNKTAYTNRKGATWTYDQDAAGRVTSETSPQVELTPATVDATGNIVVGTTVLAAVVTRFAFDALGNLTQRTEASGRAEQRITRYEYDALGRQVKVIHPPVGVYNGAADVVTTNGANGVASRVETLQALESQTFYDALGDAVANRDVGGAISQKAYDLAGRIAYEVDALGQMTGYVRNAFGEVTALTRYGSATTLAPAALTQASQAVTRAQVQAVLAAGSFDHSRDRTLLTSYDVAGRVVELKEPVGFVYDAGAAVAAQATDTAGKTTRTVYDAFGQAVQVRQLRNAAANVWAVTTHYFDKAGRETGTIDALGYLTTHAFDSFGNETESIESANVVAPGWTLLGWTPPAPSADDRIVRSTWDKLNRKTSESRVGIEFSATPDGTSSRGDAVTLYGYDAVGNQTSVTDALGNVTYSSYDKLGRIDKVAAPVRGSTSTGAALTPVTQFRRDAYGNVVSRSEYANSALAAYATTIIVGAADAADRTTRTVYDGFGRAVQTTDATGASAFTSYDAWGHTAKTWQGVTGTDGITRTLFQVDVYDKVGQLVESRSPASTTVLQTGLTAAFTAGSADESSQPATPNQLTLGWSTLVDPQGGTVRVQADYVASPIPGWTIRPLTASRDVAASAAAGGVDLTWWEALESLSTIRVLQWNGSQWSTLWQGTMAQAVGSSVATVTQAQAGLVTTALEYDTFGELTRKGTQGGRQEFFDYDTAGRLWRTNAGDGVDRIQLFDLQGNVTADIRSAGSGRDNLDIRGFANAEVANAGSTTRRVDTTYDLLGRVSRQQLPARLESQGGVSVQRAFTSVAIAGNAVAGWNESGDFTGWAGTPRIDLGWNSLAALGTGDIKVSIEYLTQVIAFGGGVDEAGTAIPVVYGTGSLKSWSSGLLDGASAASGVQAGWSEFSPGAEGGVARVTRIVVQKKDLAGTWRTVIDQAPGYGANSIVVAEPVDAMTGVLLEMRTAGSAGDTGWWSAPLVDFGNVKRFDTAALGTGSYEYRAKVLPAGQAVRTIGTGTVSLSAAPLAAIGVPIGFGAAGVGVLAWPAQGAAVGQVFRYRPVGSSGAWSTLPVASRGTSNGIDTTGLPSGSYQFELLWSAATTGVPASHATGQFTVTAARAAYWVPAVNLPPIGGFSIGTGVSGGVLLGVDENGQATYSGGTTVKALVWTASNASTVRYRVAGGSWVTLPIDNALQQTDEAGHLTGVQKALINGLGPGVYEIQVLASSPQAMQATGTLTVPAATAGYYQTVSVQVPTQQPIVSYYAPVYETRYATRQVAYSVWVSDPPVIVGYDENGSPQYSYPGHYETRYRAETYSYQVQVGQTPVYATDENGSILYQTVYVTQQQQVWVPGTTPPPTLAVTTPAYTPGYTVAAAPGQYSVSVSAAPGVLALSGTDGTVLGQSAATNGGDQWQRPTVQRKTDRWGNVVEVSDPRSAAWTSQSTYNAANQLVRETRPDVAGTISVARPVQQYFYDKLGRQVAVRDANLNVNGQLFDAGGNLVEERHADGGVVTRRYNAFGDQVASTDARGNVASYAYDRLGRQLSMSQGSVETYTVGASNAVVWQRTGLIVDSWTYDQLGRKLTQTNGNGETVRYAYDLRGNIVETRQPLGTSVRAAFDAQGRKIAEADADGYATTWSYDYFGRLTGHTDLGGARYSYGYDNARQLVSQSSTRGQSLAFGYDAAGQQTSIVDAALGKASTYAYDLAGRRIRERVVQGGVTYQDNHLSYDAQGNLRDVADARVHVSIDYDAAGNRTRVATSVDYLGVSGEASDSTQRYFRYDAMNRQVVVDAVDAAGNLGRQGHLIGYDGNGNRTSDTAWSADRVALAAGQQVITGFAADGTAVYAAAAVASSRGEGTSTEVYRYDALNRLQSVVRDGVQTDLRLYDAASRVVKSGPTGSVPAALAALVSDALAGSSTGKDIRINRYDANARMLHQKVLTAQGATRSDTSWDTAETVGGAFLVQRADGYDAAGNARGSVTASAEGDHAVSRFSTSLVRQEGYLAQRTAGTSTLTQQPGTSTQQYDGNGFLVGYTDSSQPNNDRTFVNDAAGRVLWVNQAGNVQRQLVVNGEVLGLYGAGIDPSRPASGPASNPNFANLADFDFGYARVSASYPNASPGAYQVRPGDTLQTIAQSAYGDGRLWFRIAEANGLVSSTGLKVGQTLNIPSAVGTARNDAAAFRPYDPSRIAGDMTPVMAMPSGQDGCGAGGQLLMVVVAVAVTVAAGPAGGALESWWATVFPTASGTGVSTAATVATAATAAAAGAAAGQLVGLASGTIHSFDWRSVALSAVSGGVTEGLGSTAAFHGADIAVSIQRAAVANAMTQGIGVVTGLQQRFDWRGVAAAGLATGVGMAIGDAIGLPRGMKGISNLDPSDYLLKATVRGAAAGLVAAVARGGKVAVQQVVLDAFGTALSEHAATPSETFFSASYEVGSDQSAPSKLGLRIESPGVGIRMDLDQEKAFLDSMHHTELPTIRDVSTQMAMQVMDFAAMKAGESGLKVGSWAAHFSLPAHLGAIFGIDGERLQRMTAMSQFPDQVSALDATINGARALATVSAYAPGVNGLRAQRAIHALNGRLLSENLYTYLEIIRRNVGNDDVVAIALHPLVDSVFHARTIRLRGGTTILRSYEDGLGHGLDGSHPDFASEQQIRTATGALMSAFEIIAGRQLTLQELRNATTSIDRVLSTARKQTTLGDSDLSTAIPSDERMELNVRSVSESLLAGWGTQLLKPSPIQAFVFSKPITWELTVDETQRYLSSGGRHVSHEEASNFTRAGMWAAAKVIDDYEKLTTGKDPIRPFSPKDLMDTVPWSFRSLLYPKMPSTREGWSYRDIVPGYIPKRPTNALSST